ncbi:MULTISPECIES: hypothetical protein [Enterobacteriaceae]|uniref:hypothetical protein n=1 Tax=Enterobacteriaceae TaxID=543 RepID=UPI00119F5C52|nr:MULTISPECIES: hypothetical protein [Enterobacteriaceae]
MNDEFYSDIRALIKRLKNGDNKIVGENIEEAINFSSTSTEIVLKLRFYLAQINIDNLNQEVLIEVQRIKDQVDILLD